VALFSASKTWHLNEKDVAWNMDRSFASKESKKEEKYDDVSNPHI
jgi:hypothetical protein